MDDKPQAPQPLTTPQAWLRRMADAIPGILWSTDRDLRFTSVWGAGWADLNLQPHGLVGKTLYECFGSDDQESPMIALHRRALGGETASHEHDWEGTTYQIRVAPLSDDAGQIVGCTGIALEVTERPPRDEAEGLPAISRYVTQRRRAEEQLRRAHDELDERVRDRTAELVAINRKLRAEIGEHRQQTEEALRRAERLASVGKLAAGVAHEINNPLGAIVLSAETALASKGKPDSEEILDKSLTNIHVSALRCGRIVKSILRLARAETSEKSLGDLGEVIRRALDLTQKLAADAKVAVRPELGDGPAELLMNPTEMEQVFVNLISNAVQASQPGDSVIIRMEPAADGVDVLVEDQGCGMTEEQVRRIFDPFYTTRHREGGTGLGLSITYGIVQDHAGTIRATSAPGKGTTMRVTLPLDPLRQKGTNTPDSAER